MVSDDGRQQMARMAAAAAWGLGNWDSMEEYSCLIPRESYDGAFYRAVLAVHQDHFGQAQQVRKSRCAKNSQALIFLLAGVSGKGHFYEESLYLY